MTRKIRAKLGAVLVLAAACAAVSGVAQGTAAAAACGELSSNQTIASNQSLYSCDGQ